MTLCPSVDERLGRAVTHQSADKYLAGSVTSTDDYVRPATDHLGMSSFWIIPIALVIALNLKLIASGVLAYFGSWTPPTRT